MGRHNGGGGHDYRANRGGHDYRAKGNGHDYRARGDGDYRAKGDGHDYRPQIGGSEYFTNGGGSDYRTGGMSSRFGGLLRVATGMTRGVAIVGVVVLTVAAIVAFLLVDPALNLVAGMAGVAVTSGKDAATLFGAGELAGIAIDAAKSTDLPAQILSLLAVVLKPLIVVGWALGVVVLLALPILASKLGAASQRWRG